MIRPPWLVYLAALFSRLAKTCVSRTGSPPTDIGSSASSMVSSWRMLSSTGRLVSIAALTIARQIERFLLDVDDPARDARHLEQVVDEPDQVMDLPLHHRAGRQRARVVKGAGQLQDLEAVQDRRERIAQLVAERRQELVLAAIGAAQRLLVLEALGKVAADLVLARARANRRLRRAEQRGDADRPLEQRDVAERAPGFRRFRRVGAGSRQDQNRQIRPGRLPRQPRRQRHLERVGQVFLGRSTPPPRPG